MNRQKAEIPKRLTARPRDKRGYPIPVVVMYRDDGTPDFRVLDSALVYHYAKRRLCGLCGQPMGKFVYFIGGPTSCLHPHGAFSDPPMHYECSTYALTTCPFLAYHPTKYTGISDNQATEFFKDVELSSLPMEDKPEQFYLLKTQHYELIPASSLAEQSVMVPKSRTIVSRWSNGVPESLEAAI